MSLIKNIKKAGFAIPDEEQLSILNKMLHTPTENTPEVIIGYFKEECPACEGLLLDIRMGKLKPIFQEYKAIPRFGIPVTKEGNYRRLFNQHMTNREGLPRMDFRHSDKGLYWNTKKIIKGWANTDEIKRNLTYMFGDIKNRITA